MIIIYTNKCMTCRYKKELRLLRRFAKTIDESIVIKETKFNKINGQEAEMKSDIEQPFIYYDKTSTSIKLKDVTVDDLGRLL